MELTKCYKCQSPILLMKLSSANITMAVDSEMLLVRKPGKYLNKEGEWEQMTLGDQGYVPHSTTCPYAKETNQKKYRKKKYEHSILNPILLNDLAGMEILLDKCNSLSALQKQWTDKRFQIALNKLNESDTLLIRHYKDTLKQNYESQQKIFK